MIDIRVIDNAVIFVALQKKKKKKKKKDFFSKCDQIHSLQIPSDFVTFTEEILNGKLHFCAV